MLADPLQSRADLAATASRGLGYPGSARRVSVDVTGRRTEVREAREVSAVRFTCCRTVTASATGCSSWTMSSRDYLLAHVEDVPDALTRGTAWVTMWDNLLERRIEADAVPRPRRCVRSRREQDEQNAQRVLWLRDATVLAASHTESSVSRRGQGSRERFARGSSEALTQSQKAAWFNAFRDTVLSQDGLAWLERVWRREEAVPGLTLAEPDEIALALELAVREVPRWEEILRVQAMRTQNPDRKARFAFVMPALVSRSRCARAGVRAALVRREPATRAVGARVAAVSAITHFAKRMRGASSLPSPGAAAGDSADRGHLLSQRAGWSPR